MSFSSTDNFYLETPTNVTWVTVWEKIKRIWVQIAVLFQVGVENMFKHLICVGISHLKSGWPNCIINGLVKMSINLVKVEIWTPHTTKRITEWTLDVWSQLSQESIIKSFKYCGLNPENDGREDDFIHCFKNHQI